MRLTVQADRLLNLRERERETETERERESAGITALAKERESR